MTDMLRYAALTKVEIKVSKIFFFGLPGTTTTTTPSVGPAFAGSREIQL